VKENMINKKLGMMAVALMILFAVAPAFAATTASQSVTVNVAPTIAISVDNNALTYNLNADGIGSTQNFNVRSYSNVRTDMTISASALSTPAGSDPLGLSDFTWVATGGNSGALSTGSQTLISNVAKAPKNGFTAVPVSLTVAAPFGTDPGAYSTTITYTITQHS
jgi:hypothetical protein